MLFILSERSKNSSSRIKDDDIDIPKTQIYKLELFTASFF